MDVHLIAMLMGFAGGVVVLASFAGTAAGRLSVHGAPYHVMNIGGAAAMIASGFAAGAWPSVVVNAVWALISAHVLVRSGVRRVAAVQHERVPVGV